MNRIDRDRLGHGMDTSRRSRRQCGATLVLATVCTLGLPCASPGRTATVSVQTDDGFAARAEGTTLSGMTLDSQPVPDVDVTVTVVDPRNGRNAEGFSVDARWTGSPGCLRLEGEVQAPGEEDTVADLVIHVHGVELPLGRIADNPLLLPAALLSKLPLVSLRRGDEDSLALAVPPDRLAVYRFIDTAEGVELRFPFGFTKDAKPELRMRAPFACVLYRTEPEWRFRSALKQYYRLFPEPFTPFIRKGGGWFFAAPTRDVPNPQHFYYHEGGPTEWQEDDERGMATYPYQESSSWTIHLPGKALPQSYSEAMERFAELQRQETPKSWQPQASFILDAAVRRTGTHSLLADSGTSGAWTGGRQAIILEKPTADPIVVRGFSKAEGVSGEPDSDYSIYVDVCYASGGYQFGQCATFSTGSHDWEAGEYVIHPTEPVAELRVYCLLRGRQGKAWFDDIHVGPANRPEINWLTNPGFEEYEKRRDLQHVRNNVCVNSRGEYVVAITNNLSADVGPVAPMNLLRFTLNVDPDLPDTPEKPNVAGRQFESYDRIFREFPSVDGCYIDSVSAWCYRVMNCRRDQWLANDRPFGYDPSNFAVGAHGRFAMTDFLAALQRRYHPQGKAIFTNIHVNLEAFPLYLVSDVPGIESSRFDDQNSIFFYRACSYKKPVLLMNFMNLHGLDNREVAERFHHNAAQWGELPSTGRFVQEAYRLYGDVTHAWMPVICELAEAGWEPIPLASGAWVERFPRDDAVYFTVRASEGEASRPLLIDSKAMEGIDEELVGFDAVSLEPITVERQEGSCIVRPTFDKGPVFVLRIASQANTRQWLLERSRNHVEAACQVRGKASLTLELAAAREAIRRLSESEPGYDAMRVAREAFSRAIQSVSGPENDLFSLSTRRELQQAEQALYEYGMAQ